MKKRRIKIADIQKDDLEYLIYDRYFSIVLIAKMMDCSIDFISSCINRHSITIDTSSTIKSQYDQGRKVNCKIYDIPPKEDIHFLYNDKQMSLNTISKMFDTSIPTLKKWMIGYDMDFRTRSETQKLTVNPKRTSEAQIGKESSICLDNKQWLIDAYNVCSTESIADLLKVSPSCIIIRMKKYNIERDNHLHYSTSSSEQEVADFISEYTTIQQHNRRILKDNKELDIFIPDHNIAIEFNGLYWHSEGQGKDRNYHLNKTEECEAQGVQLFHIFDVEWDDPHKQEIWKSVLRNAIGVHERKIGARKTTIREVSNKEANDFLTKNHLQGRCNSSIRCGLYYVDELVSLMTFGKSRFDATSDYELIRFCSALNTQVYGAASKLLKHFRCTHSGGIVSYANRRWSTGGLYGTIGFDYCHDSKPNYFYWNSDMVLESRNKFQKHKLEDRLGVYDPRLTEVNNMVNNGYDRIWDSGNKVYKLAA